MSSKILEQEPLSLSKVIVILLVLVLFGSGILFTARFVSKQREKNIITTYTQETNNLINTNEQLFASFFLQGFSECQNEYDLENTRRQAEAAEKNQDSYIAAFDIKCDYAQNTLALLKIDTLKDYSSILFVKVDKSNRDSVSTIDPSGKYDPNVPFTYFVSQRNFNYNNDFKDYVLDGKEILMWQDFTNIIGQKEVLVPVEIKGEVVGYILRGVLEK